MDLFTTLLIMFACLLAEGFFSGSEIGIVSADKIKLRHNAAKGSSGARLTLKMLEKPEWLLSTTLVGTNIAVVTNTTMATALMIDLFGEQYGWLAIVIVAPLIWVFGEIVPKSIFQQYADIITPKAIFVLRAASVVFAPILFVFSTLSHLFTKMVGGDSQNPFTMREEIVAMLKMSDHSGDIQPVEKKMIKRVFNFSETTAYEVMVPLIDVIAIEKSTSLTEARNLAVKSTHSRLPVYEDRIDNVIGVVDVLEWLGLEEQGDIEPYTRPVRYVPGTRNINALLVELRQDGDAMIVVVDEFGGAEGIITLEDIVEEVVDELEDEYDSRIQDSSMIKKIGNNQYLAQARLEVDVLEEMLGLKFPEGNFVTLGGLLLDKAKEVPRVGEEIHIADVRFEITKASARAIKEVRLYIQ